MPRKTKSASAADKANDAAAKAAAAEAASEVAEADAAPLADADKAVVEPQDATPAAPKRKRSSRNQAAAAAPAEPAVEAAPEAPPAAEAHPARSRDDQMREMNQREAERNAQRLETEVFAATWAGLQSAMRRRTPVWARVLSIERVFNTDPNTNMNVGSAMLKVVILKGQKGSDFTPILAMVPFAELHRDFPIREETIDLTTPAGCQRYIRRQVNMSRKFLGQDIPVVITTMARGDNDDYNEDGPTYAVAASRKQALEVYVRQNFEAVSGSTPRIVEGMEVDADIVSVSEHALYINIGGVDCRMPDYEATFRYVTDANQYFKAGGTMRVVVRSIRKRNDGAYVLSVSGRAVELKESLKKIKQGMVSIGATVKGKFVQINPSKNNPRRITAVAILDPPMSLPVMVNTFDPRTIVSQPITGDDATFEVTGFTPDGFVVANCTGTFGFTSGFNF